MIDWKILHRIHMYGFLKHIYSSPRAKRLGFKGGTALYFFYQLPRFSVDLDFDLIEGEGRSHEGFLEFLNIYAMQHDMKIKKDGTSTYSHRWIVQYAGAKKLKIEIHTSSYPNKYERKNLLGTRIYVMDRRRMFAHKLCAFVSRYQHRNVLANRDLYDIHFFLGMNIKPDAEIIKIRSLKLIGKECNISQWYIYLTEFIMTHKSKLSRNILDGLGELIDNKATKHRLKEKLLPELIEKLGLASMG